MPRARANGIEIEYDEFGAKTASAMLLIMGLGAQMILWREDFCEQLAKRGYRIIRFDNRDVGKSTTFAHLGMPDVIAATTASLMRQPINAPYLLRDMAADAVGLLDALGIDRAHVVGASMGGMIAQTLAIEFPERVRSLTSIMSTTGDPTLPPPKPEAMGALLSPLPNNRDEAIERSVFVFRTIGSTGFPFDEAEIRDLASQSYERGFEPAGVTRQLVAIMASGSRTTALASVRVPALVIHGTDDPLIQVDSGRATAAAIPNAELLLIEGMGHDMPRPVWPRMVDAICAVAGRA